MSTPSAPSPGSPNAAPAAGASSSSAKVLVATAHDDDSALWAFHYLSTHPGTHVASCCIDRRKPERIEHFYRACEKLKAEPFIVAGAFSMWDLDTRPIEAFAAGYDTIITHNERGEYGHPAHIKLHHAMKSLGKRLLCFNHGISEGKPIDFAAKQKVLACYTTETFHWIERQKQIRLDLEALLVR